jgi:mannose-6-phosphate isomerase
MVDGPEGTVSLADVIAAGPQETLGAAAAAEFGPRLPYLLKLLAAEEPLSLQAHPDVEQARARFAAERDGVAEGADSAQRNYADPYHKPELLAAVTRFEALCGFRDPKVSAELLGSAGIGALDPVVSALRAGAPDGLREAVETLLTWPRAQRRSLVSDVVEAGAGLGAEHEFAGAFALAGRLAAKYADDVGVVVALLLNHVRLQPGEAVWMPAGNLHAYLRGTGVEIMANSDNVLRCGLTGKHVDVQELLRITDFTELRDPRWPSVGGSFDVPVPDFRLTRLEIDESTGLHDPGPLIVLGTSGEVAVGDVATPPGHAAFVPAGTATTISGRGVVFIAGAGG